MSTTTPVTAEELLNLPDDGNRYALVAGELRMMSPAGWRHGKVVARLQLLLGSFVLERNLGETFAAETGFLIARDPDTVRAPDIAFVGHQRMGAGEPQETFWPGPPDLAVEVVSPGDRTGEVNEKIHAWLDAGARLVWVVDPQLELVSIYGSLTDVEVRTRGQTLDGRNVVPGFSCEIADIFPKQ